MEPRDSRLVALRLADMPLSAPYPFHRQLSPRVQVFLDWARDVYADRFGTRHVGQRAP